jgi:hypothetical protein
MPPSGDYLLCVAPMATRATANKTTTKKWTNLLAILMAMGMRQYDTAHIA